MCFSYSNLIFVEKLVFKKTELQQVIEEVLIRSIESGGNSRRAENQMFILLELMINHRTLYCNKPLMYMVCCNDFKAIIR